MDARKLIEEYETQTKLISAISGRTMSLALFIDTNSKNKAACALAKTLLEGLKPITAISYQSMLFNLERDETKKIAMVIGNRQTIAEGELQLLSATSSIIEAENVHANKSILEKMRSQNPYKKLRPLVEAIANHPDVISGFSRNQQEIQIAKLSTQTNRIAV